MAIVILDPSFPPLLTVQFLSPSHNIPHNGIIKKVSAVARNIGSNTHGYPAPSTTLFLLPEISHTHPNKRRRRGGGTHEGISNSSRGNANLFFAGASYHVFRPSRSLSSIYCILRYRVVQWFSVIFYARSKSISIWLGHRAVVLESLVL